jgi:hypothetical protein
MIQADERWSRGSVKALIGVKEEVPKKDNLKKVSRDTGNGIKG